MNIEAFGKFIADRRKVLGMTQKELAEKLNVTPKAVSRWERCIGYPDIETFQLLASSLEVSVDSLFACKVKDAPLHNKDVLQIIQSSVEIERKNNKVQERIVTGLIVCVSIITGVLFYISGHGNIGGSLFFGLLASGFVVSVYYLLAEDSVTTRKIYTAIATAFLLIVAGILIFVLRK